MLPKLNRLRRSREFSQVYRQGRKAVSGHLIVRVWSAPLGSQEAPPRIGIVVSQKVHRRAVVRNRLKRQVRAGMSKLLPVLKPNLWVVINLRPEAVQCEYGEILRELEQLFTKLEVLHGHS
ncbi:ribonuclease P protein component [Nodosilinea sp. LEGE 07088]|uniref:ribonuclease P protein component n=1 Tax=Nodosilinea sp. LEGE 07088 TaxID=2777968 RepID=UPI001881EA49|nr:ribonuclease P protein component [Nodosilinea sp. LEGE 07088]MBE9139865.1 ribonuclease P protein component [Nodosilinea sp. LEGE 07088]